jgi:hypothetical protein
MVKIPARISKMNDYNFSMYIAEGEDGSPLIVMQVEGLEDMKEAEIVAEEIFAVINGSEGEEVH